MAKQIGTIKIIGTIGRVCFYKLEDSYYARTKSSLSGKKVKTCSKFAKTMCNAGLFARASVIGSAVYRMRPLKEKNRRLNQQLTGQAMKMLKSGLEENEIIKSLKASLDF